MFSSFNIFFNKSLRIALINIVTILMMSAKMATLGLLKIKVFLNKDYDVIFLSMTSATKFYHMNQIVFKILLCDQSSVTLAFL